MKFDFKDKNVLITGAGNELGVAKEFAKAGANIVVIDIEKKSALSVAKELESLYGVKTIFANIDVCNYNDFVKLAQDVVKKWGSIDILVNSAGICLMDKLVDMDEKTISSILDVNLKGTVYACKAVLPHMIKNSSGKIINMASSTIKQCLPKTSVYTSSKAGVVALTTSLAKEYKKDNININCILPKTTRDNYQEEKENPIDIAYLTLFLCSEQTKNITGQCIGIDEYNNED